MGDIGHMFLCSRFQIRKILLSQGEQLRKGVVFDRVPDPTPEEIAERATALRRATEANHKAKVAKDRIRYEYQRQV